jgi:anaerobic magnesium-protoporphyrin IX monomethyl ester cyclase
VRDQIKAEKARVAAVQAEARACGGGDAQIERTPAE